MAVGRKDNPTPDEGQAGNGSPVSPLPRTLRIPDPNRLKKQARVTAKQAIRRRVPGEARYAFRVDVTAMFLAGLYTGAVFPFVNVIARKDLHASPQVLALLTAAPFIGNLLALFLARAMEGSRKVPFVKWCHIVGRFCVSLAFFATSAVPFAAVIAASQLIGAVPTPAYAAIIKDVYPVSQRGRILSISRASIVVAQIVATLLAGWLLTFVSYQYVFPAGAVAGMAAAVVFSRIQREPNIPPDEEPAPEAATRPAIERMGHGITETGRFIWNTLGILKTDPAYRWFALSVFTYGFGNLLTVPIIPVLQVDELHIETWQISVMTVAQQVVMVGSFFYWGRFVDLKSPQLGVVVNVLLNAIVPLVYIAAGTVLPGNPWMLIPAFIITGVVGAGIDLSYFSALLTFAGERDVGRYQALQSFLLGVRGTIAPFIGGGMVQVLKDHHLNLRWAFVVSLVFMLAGCWMQRVAMRRQQRGAGC
ncbi:MAG: major facilitator superfamily 1 [Armatimonadetes bacterium]|nr:major facilitator superfamily 1 [Armatimonadota bacterium]